jgi:Domain of unknown function (DUF4189)
MMFGRKSAIFIASTAAAFCTTAMIAAPPAHADGAFAAIAYSPSTHGAGWAINKSSRAEAEQAALKDCSNFTSGCQPVTWNEGGCVTLAENKSGNWSGGRGANTAAAESEALSRVPNGYIVHTACNG